MRAGSLIFATVALPLHALAMKTGMQSRKQRVRVPDEKSGRKLERDEYRLMRAPKMIDGLKQRGIGSRVVDRDGITVDTSEDGVIGVTVNVDVDVGVNVNGGSESESSNDEPDCIEWETKYEYVQASSKSSKASAKSGKGSKSQKSGKVSKEGTMLEYKRCIAYATKSPTTEPVPIVTPSPVPATGSPVEVRPTPIPTMINITPDPSAGGQVPITQSPMASVETQSPSATVSTMPGSEPPVVASSFPSPGGDVSLPPVVTQPPQSSSSPPQASTPDLPTLQPQSLSSPPQASTPDLPTLPPQSLSSPPQASTPDLPTLPPLTSNVTGPPQIVGLPTLPPLTSNVTGPPQIASLPTLPPVSSGNVTGPPQIVGLPTLPPLAGNVTGPPQGVLPTLPPASSGNVMAPPQIASLPTLPPASSGNVTGPPQIAGLPTLPPASGNITSPPQVVGLPTLPPQTNGLPTLPPQIGVSSPPQIEDLNVLTYDFEDGAFPVSPWTTDGDGVWAIDQTQVDGDGGVYSIKSPDLESIFTGTGLTSNATLTLDDSFSGGVLKMRVYASVQPPADIFVVYIDGVDAAQLADNGEFSDVALAVSPGAHTIDLSYQYNPFSISDLPESPPTRLGATWVDNVSIESMAEAPDSRASASSAYTTTFPDIISLSTLPTGSPTYYPSIAPAEKSL